jgi:hypothetical protein
VLGRISDLKFLSIPTQRLIQLRNPIFGSDDGQNTYISFKALMALIFKLVRKEYDHCKCKLICDDLGLASLIFQSREDLSGVGVTISSHTLAQLSFLSRRLRGFF